MDLDCLRDKDGKLPAYAWPGGYPIDYFDKLGGTLCAECANREVDDSQATIAYDINWEDAYIFCYDCGEALESAYA